MEHKAEVVKIGYIEKGKPFGFTLDCKGTISGIEVLDDGTVLYGGWTEEELKSMVDT